MELRLLGQIHVVLRLRRFGIIRHRIYEIEHLVNAARHRRHRATSDQGPRTKNEGLKDYACAGCAVWAQNLSNASVRMRAIVSAVWFSI